MRTGARPPVMAALHNTTNNLTRLAEQAHIARAYAATPASQLEPSLTSTQHDQ